MLCAVGALLIPALPIAADHCDGGWCSCPGYDVLVGTDDGRYAAGANTETLRLYAAADAPLFGQWYLFVDEVFLVTPHGDEAIFSIWLYPESNGEPGAQRDDEQCTSCPDGPGTCESDVLLP